VSLHYFVKFTHASRVSKTKHNLISVCKLVDNCFKTCFRDVFILIIVIFKHLYFTR